MRTTQSSVIINQILDYIRDHNLLPGDPLPPENDLMSHLKISRSTLREAIRELRTLQIVEVRHGFGTFIGQGSLDFLSKALVFRILAPGRNLITGLIELIEVRSILEVNLAEQVMQSLTEDQVERLYEATERMEQHKENSASDREFHTVLYENIHNDIVRQLIAAFWESFDLAQIPLPTDEHVVASKVLHQDIITAYQSGDVQQAKTAMHEHFSFIRKRLEKAQQQAAV